jgi:hypothetical protein
MSTSEIIDKYQIKEEDADLFLPSLVIVKVFLTLP